MNRAIHGCLMGTLFGDAMGLPFEGMSSGRVKRMMKSPMEFQLLLGHGMVSDDTEHAAIVCSALIESWQDPGYFRARLARRLCWWFWRLPPGVGFATARALIKASVGVPVDKSGVYSAGNGPAMRSPMLGVVYAKDSALMKTYVRYSTQITHTDPRAYLGALAVALAASWSSQNCQMSFEQFIRDLTDLSQGEDEQAWEELLVLLKSIECSLKENESLEEFLARAQITDGISGYIYHTVPAVLFLWQKFREQPELAIRQIILAGGDTDTSAAILGAILGASPKADFPPMKICRQVVDWPVSVESLNKTSEQLSQVIEKDTAASVPWLFGPLVVLRNMIMLMIVIGHGLRRLLPPYK
ncbi:ADP-ribosylglycohydrolase family protein [Pleionea sp. CnH1-48]|uniref:ADP-ribosylglycohydrolase family protein n=1 Tax=Pleionea sp. CnH1-48 TaxID=2954494 RepID=UPI002096FED1|nr:ADP-ribosylglycohydrolase family protein [Pleionea sp. CnH1-48]MCO7226737.1 ADP-ribosylglycohydrolase family protein [Pleionea sp. CnH1-48]